MDLDHCFRDDPVPVGAMSLIFKVIGQLKNSKGTGGKGRESVVEGRTWERGGKMGRVKRGKGFGEVSSKGQGYVER